MKNVIKFILRFLFLPIALLFLGGTAIMEFMSRDPDWEFWRMFNKGLISVLPFRL